MSFPKSENQMLVKAIWSCLLAISIFSGIGCQKRNPQWNEGKDFPTQIAFATSSGTEFRKVALKGVKDKETLAGTMVDFYYAPGDNGGKLFGDKPLAKYVVDSDGIYVPADQVTLQMVTVYYNLQQLKEMELKATEKSESRLTWPRKVGLAVNIENGPEVVKHNNASYNGITDALYFVPYTLGGLPLVLNPAVVAHEHFHSYFFKDVMLPLAQKNKISLKEKISEQSEQEFYNIYVLKTLNEGLADVWGWAYSQDPDFMALSAIKNSEFRKMDLGKFKQRIATKDLMKDEIRNFKMHGGDYRPEDLMTGYSYIHGTELARALKALGELKKKNGNLSIEQTQKFMVKNLLALIDKIETTLAANGTISLDDVLQSFADQIEYLSDEECKLLKDFSNNPGVFACSKNKSSSL